MSDERPEDGTADVTRLPGSHREPPARTLGNYHILQTLGEGGMGTVYLAEQFHPVRRRVALKVIKVGMDSGRVVARFESERQALALMNHRNIARIHDAGTTPEGSPYFAMEYVEGQPIIRYCDQRRLALAERLELFAQVCEGVQHAHQKGIIHRDLKPSNVLVRERDAKRVPKIIDFGVAKATSQPLTERPLHTELGQLIGTPEYMSPEQAEMTGMDIDTRTDVYQLGVMLYELLTGRLPFESEELRLTGFNEFRRRIIEEEALRPSAVVAAADPAKAAASAAARGLEPGGLVRALRGDLDWIVMKALEKDRMRRYASASELAADIERHLRDEPVLAGPPSQLYRMRKFTRRHLAGVAFGAVLLVLLVGFAAAMAVQVELLARARDVASQEADAAEQVSEFLVRLFELSDPRGESRGSITARELLDSGAAEIEGLQGQPLAQARLLHTMGRVYASLGMHQHARSLLEQALALREQELGEHPEVAETMEVLAGVLYLQHGEPERAVTLARRALEIRREQLGPEDPSVADSLTFLGSMLATMGDPSAEAMHEQALEIRERVLPPDDPEIAVSLTNRAGYLKRQGRYDEAQRLNERALEIWRSAGDELRVAESLRHLAGLYEMRADWKTARRHREQQLEIERRVLGEEHPDVAPGLMALALLELELGERRRAAATYERASRILERAEHLETPLVLYQRACYEALAGRSDAALDFLRQAVVDRAFGDEAMLLRDPHLAAVRGEPGFAAILAAVRDRGVG